MRRHLIERVALFSAVALAACLNSLLSQAGDTSDKTPKVELSREERIEQALDRPCEIALANMPLEKVAAELEKHYHIAVRLETPALMEVGVDPERRVTLEKQGTLATELIRMLHPCELTICIRHESLFITSKAAAESTLEARVYPVRDLLAPIEPGLFERPDDYTNLIETITTTVHPTSWSEVGGVGSVIAYPNAGALVILQTWEDHREVSGLLAAVRAAKATEGARGLLSQFVAASPTRSRAVTISSGIDSNKLRHTMRKKVAMAFQTDATLDFPAASIDRIVTQTVRKCGFPVRLDAVALREAGINPVESGHAWHSAYLSLGSTLTLALRGWDLTWVIDDDGVLVTTRSAADVRQETRTYPVRDLVVSPLVTGACVSKPDHESLIEVLTAAIVPTSWCSVGGTGSLTYLREGDLLTISQTKDTHEEIEQLLSMLRDVRKRQFKDAPLEPKPEKADAELPLRIYEISAKPKVSGMGYFNFDEKQEQKPAAAVATPKPDATAPPATAKCEAPAAPAVNADNALAEQLAKAIPELIEPQTWQAGGGKGKIFAVGRRLLVRQTCEVHAKIRELLAAVGQ